MQPIKNCSMCKKTKSLLEFWFRKDQNNYRANCKECCSKGRKKYYKKNKKKLLIWHKKYRLDNKDKINTDKIFNYMNNIDLFRSKQIFYRSNNLGTASSVIKGINYVANKEKKFIVLEEDLIVSNQFLYFCNNLLKLYKNEKNVWHINGWVFDNLKFEDEFFFSTHMSCWGWATWSDRWKNFKKIKKKTY